MILTDVNVLVYAHRRDAPDHEHYADWLSDVAAGRDELGLTEATLLGFLRVVTSPRIFSVPALAAEALRFVDALRGARRARWLPASEAVWTAFARIARADPQVRGNVVPDAWLAALAQAHGCRLATTDRGFARFDGLDWFDPARP